MKRYKIKPFGPQIKIKNPTVAIVVYVLVIGTIFWLTDYPFNLILTVVVLSPLIRLFLKKK